MLSGRQPNPGVKILRRCREWLRPNLQGAYDGLHSEDGDGVIPYKVRELSQLDTAVFQRKFYSTNTLT